MDYPIKTLAQLRPILQGFRKAAGLTQAGMASRLGVTQQTYAQLEANPAAVSVDRLFKVLRVLQVDLTLILRTATSSEDDTVAADKPSPARKAAVTRPPKKVARKVQASRNQAPSAAAPAPARISKAKAPSRKSRDGAVAVSRLSRGTSKPNSAAKKREDW